MLTFEIALIKHRGEVLKNKWLADFDAAGMIRATRMPFGSANKLFCKIGDIDIDDNVLEEKGFTMNGGRAFKV